jgi:PIN domain nuclease of toxin-antitoxin system
LQNADKRNNIIYISIISIVEIMYLAERKKIPLKLDDVLEKVASSDNYQIVELSTEIVNVAKDLQELELHVRLIVATAKYLALLILTSDSEILESNLVEAIWS